MSGLPPTICVGQADRHGPANRRSTVGTITEIHDYLRLLYARCGLVQCPGCGRDLPRTSLPQILTEILALPEGEKLLVLAPLVRRKNGDHREAFLFIRREGFVRARVDGALTLVGGPIPLDPESTHDIDMVVDRQILRPGIEGRMEESLATALRHGKGSVVVARDAGGEWIDRIYSTQPVCLECDIRFPDLEPKHFSFNSPEGACPRCQGLGVIDDADAEPSESANDDDSASEALLCPECNGSGLNMAARSVTIGGQNLADFTSLPLGQARAVAAGWRFPPEQQPIADPILEAILRRLSFLDLVGVNYLSLDRRFGTLSGGERQRARLAACVAAGVHGAAYILDEPTAGLHPRDIGRLLELLERLRDGGNSVLLIEHDPTVIRQADWVIELGPGAGEAGGHIIQSAPLDAFLAGPSLTAEYLSGRRQPSSESPSIVRIDEPALVLSGASHHNLNGVTVRFPLGHLIAVTGVSGSGKSSLVIDCLVPAVRQALAKNAASNPRWKSLTGAESLEQVVVVDQRPIGRTPRSTPASYCGIAEPIRKIFAATRTARARGYTASRFSPNHATGRCPRCKGLGAQLIDLVFLPEEFVPCPVCQGRRFNRTTLEVRFRDRSIAEVYDMTINQAADFFANHSKVARLLEVLKQVGLGYLRLGQWGNTLSGGESQRLKLAERLAKGEMSPTLFVLDEPTSGLHVADVAVLLGVLRSLVARGHSVIVIEHHLDMVSAADWIIDLGPEGGRAGGSVIGEGPPSLLASLDTPTGRALALYRQEEAKRHTP